MHALDCPETLELLAAFEANELDALSSLGVEKHLHHCTGCREQWRWEQEVSGSLRRLRDAVPGPSAELLSRVARPPQFVADRRPQTEVGFSLFAGRLRVRVALVAAAAAAVLLLLAAAGGVVAYRSLPGGWAAADAAPLPALVANHTRAVSGGGPATELTTGNPAAAEEWLRARLPFSVRGPQRAPADFRLMGARVCRAGRVPAGVLIYEHAGQRISCFIRRPDASLPSISTDADGLSQQRLVALPDGRQAVCGRCRGNSFAAWQENGLSYVLVADLPEAALIAFVEEHA